MLKRAAVLLGLAATGLFATGPTGAASRHDADPQSVAQGPGIVAGVVMDSSTGRGVARAIVRALGQNGVQQTRLSDDLGRYYFAGLTPGDWSLTAHKAGYIDGAFGKTRASGSGIPLTVFSGMTPFVARVDLFRPAVISGYVVDEAGEPLVGVNVRAMRRELVDGLWTSVLTPSEVTDDEGYFRLFDLIPGEYLVMVPTSQVTVPAAALEEVGQTGSVTAEMSTVFNANGVPTSAGVALSENGRTATVSARSAQAPPQPDGRPAAYRTLYYPGIDRLRSAVPIIVGSGAHHGGVFFQMLPVPATRVSGIVSGPQGPVRNQILRLLDLDDDDTGVGSEVAITLSAPDGSFTFLEVPAGRYVLESRGRVLMPADVPILVPSDLDGIYMWGRSTLAVEDDPIEDFEMLVTPRPRFEGRIVFESTSGLQPNPSADLTVSLIPANSARPPISMKADRNGQFAMIGVVPGEYVVRTLAPRGWFVKRVAVGGRTLIEGSLTVDEGSDPDEVVITLTDRPNRVSGAVRDVRGMVAAGAAVVVLPGGPTGVGADARRARVVRSAWNGVYSVDALPPGDYILTAISEATMDGWQEPRRLAAIRAAGTPVSIRESDNRSLDLRLTVVR
jgi:hypothetical protein